MSENNKNKFRHNDDGTTHIFVESKSKRFPGKHTIIIDTEDWNRVKDYKWALYSGSGGVYPYAQTNIPDARFRWRMGTDGYRRRRNNPLCLHHLIMGKPQKGKVTDHRNHNGLDNRKANLKEVTYAQNNQNTRPRKNSTSQYKGVDRMKRYKGKWRAQILHEGKKSHLGLFMCEKEAALAYNKKALELWGEHALLNEVEASGA
jgi:hypothetical protein